MLLGCGQQAAQQVAAEGDPNAESRLYRAPDLMTRPDWLAGKEMRTKATHWWTTRTRVIACSKSVVTLDDRTDHAEKLAGINLYFYHKFLNHGYHYYERRRVPDGTTSVLLCQIFSDYSPIRVNTMNIGKYFYVVFSSERDCAAALKASATQLFQSNLNAHVTLRPLIGYTAFSNERPKLKFVEDVTLHSFVCTRLLGLFGLLGLPLPTVELAILAL